MECSAVQRGAVQVVVMTHAYGDHVRVRYMTNGLKVYYCPRLPFYQGASVPVLWLSLPLLRSIVARERISVIHGHQAFSPLCHEAILHARALGVPAVFTDHSLDGFTGVSSIHVNKVLFAQYSSICTAWTPTSTSGPRGSDQGQAGRGRAVS